MPRFRLASLAALLALAAALTGTAAAHAQAAVPAARASVIDHISEVALTNLLGRQLPDGRFDDPLGKVVGGGGLPTVAFAALHASGPAAEDREKLARRTLSRGDGATVVLRWPLAMAVADDLERLSPEDREKQRARVASWGQLRAAGVANRCYVKPTCFNNYKLVDALLNLELARSGVTSRREGTRLANPAGLRSSAVAFLAKLGRFAPAGARVVVPGRATQSAALLTDPGALPLAYHAMCTAWAVRATRLLGKGAPAGLRNTTRRALWALVGLAAPDGEVSWSGRGQDQSWTLSAALYAASAGASLFADSDPTLAARLRHLADVELHAIDGRLTDQGLQILPAGNGRLQGLDHYYSGVGSTGLALTFLEMARDELPKPGAPRAALPSEIQGAGFVDAARSGIVTKRAGRTWMGLRMRRDHAFDPRQDMGVARAMHLEADGWHEDRVARPAPLGTASRAPLAGPALVVGHTAYALKTTSYTSVENGVELGGGFSGHGLARATIRATDRGVSLQVTCPRGATLQTTEFLPRAGTLQRGARFVARGGASIHLPKGFKVRPLTSRYANARTPSLAAYRVTMPCGKAGTATLRWSGGAKATG